MNLTTRAEHIRNRLSRHCLTDLEVSPSPMPIGDWDQAAHELGPHARFGLGFPVRLPDGAREICVPFCPEQLDRVTNTLTEEDLEGYLDTVESLIGLELANLFDGIEPEEAVRLAELHMLDAWPGSMDLFWSTQASALDRGIGRA